MKQRHPLIPGLLGFELVRTQPLGLQIVKAIKDGILDGTLPRGLRLPSSRELSHQLGCSRNVVRQVYDQLIAEAYLETVTRSGTVVCKSLPRERFARKLTGPRERQSRWADISNYGMKASALPLYQVTPAPTFTLFETAVDSFPFDIWAKLFVRHWRNPRVEMLRDHDPAGLLALRKAISSWVLERRGITCHPDQVIICTGEATAYQLLMHFLIDPGDEVWIEEPSFLIPITSIKLAGGVPVSIPTDAGGIVVAAGCQKAPRAKIAIVSPWGIFFSMGQAMSVERRRALLEWASQADSLIIEDDINVEFRYDGRPLPAIAALDYDGRVIYAGTFSNYIFPSLRMSYLIVPPALAAPLTSLRFKVEFHPPITMQPVLASFIEDGHLATHARRMQRVYTARRQALIRACEQYLPNIARLRPIKAGLTAVLELTGKAKRLNDKDLAAACAKAGMGPTPLSMFYLGEPPCAGLVLGFGGTDESHLVDGVRRLAEIIGMQMKQEVVTRDR